MDRFTYRVVAELIDKVPPKSKTPQGQKFNIGEIVKIVNPINWFSQESFEEDKERLFEIEFSYYQKYDGADDEYKKLYSLKHLFEDDESAWYNEDELELVRRR